MVPPTAVDDSNEASHRTSIGGKVVVVMFAMVAAAVFSYFALAMPGMDMSSDTRRTRSQRGMGDMSMPAPTSRLLSPMEFAAALKTEAFVVNVHTPAGDEISGTDAVIPFTAIAGDPRLPSDRNARILLYCKSGRMSAVAARSLLDAGYERVFELRGGLNAWTGRGYGVTPGPA